MALRLLGTKILVEEESVENKVNFIDIPKPEKLKEGIGVIKFVGPGLADDPITVSVGERIKFSTSGNIKTEYEGKQYTQINQSDIIFIY